MDLVFLLIIVIYIGYYLCKKEGFSSESIENFGEVEDQAARKAVREIYNADIEAIKNLSDISKKLQAGGFVVPGVLQSNKINLNPDNWENLHQGNGKSYVVNDHGNYKKLMLVGNDTGGGGVRRVGVWDDMEISRNLQVNGGINSNGNINAPSVSTNNPTWNGWISGNFGMNGKDRLVIGNLENQATVGAHNNALNAWTPLRLQGDSVNIIANNGNITSHGNLTTTGRSSFGGGMSEGIVNIRNRDGSYTHFNWPNGWNYIRGNTVIDGNMQVNGKEVYTGAGGKGGCSRFEENSLRCPDGKVMVGLEFWHPCGQDLTYQERFRLICK
jgi:hypothetical protein